jgi:putative Holliday junction resolvase
MIQSHNKTRQCLALDVGERRIGVAIADTATRIPVPYTTLNVDGLEHTRIRELVAELGTGVVIVGLPRNQHGEETAQSQITRDFASKLVPLNIPIILQDESLTSVLAEKYLNSQKKPYTKADVDMHAAAIILGDYLEANYGH